MLQVVQRYDISGNKLNSIIIIIKLQTNYLTFDVPIAPIGLIGRPDIFNFLFCPNRLYT